MYSGTRPRDAVTNAPDLGPGGGPGARRQYFLFAGAAPMRMDWSRMIKACTQPYLCYAPTLRFTILPPPLVLLDSIFFNLSYRLCRRPSFFIFGGASTPFFIFGGGPDTHGLSVQALLNTCTHITFYPYYSFKAHY
jgi:hypothetical protein